MPVSRLLVEGKLEIAVLAPLLEHTARLFRDVLETNLMGTFLMTRAAARAMIAGDRQGRIINLASVDSFVAEEFAAGYVASKAGILGLTRASAVELAPHRITVNAIAPGPFDSKMMAFALDNPATRAAIAGNVPLGRIGQPDDMAGTAIFPASRAGSYLTGAVIPVDGGIAALRR